MIKRVVEGIVNEEYTSAQAGAFLALLAAKGGTRDETLGVIKAMQGHMVNI